MKSIMSLLPSVCLGCTDRVNSGAFLTLLNFFFKDTAHFCPSLMFFFSCLLPTHTRGLKSWDSNRLLFIVIGYWRCSPAPPAGLQRFKKAPCGTSRGKLRKAQLCAYVLWRNVSDNQVRVNRRNWSKELFTTPLHQWSVARFQHRHRTTMPISLACLGVSVVLKRFQWHALC